MVFFDIIKQQQVFFDSGKTKDITFTRQQLSKLKSLLKENESLLYAAIYQDFGKSAFETYLSELALIYHELKILNKNLKKWRSPKRVPTDLANFPGKSYIYPEPLGHVLVIGAWNYPYQLSLLPALTALAAGNTVILKPSELPSRTAQAMAKIINENFPAGYFYVLEGGVQETTELLKNRFDKIFFTGSTRVGKIVYEAAAKQLTPVTLELGGKSPTFVLADTDLSMTVKRIVWAKFLNAGQTCVAPDYILVEKSIETKFLEVLKQEINSQFKVNNELTEHYVQIIDQAHLKHLENLIDSDKIYLGGSINYEKRLMMPTVLQHVNFSDAVMQEEIFGPILPVITFENLDKAIQQVQKLPKPLSCYVYGKDKKRIDKIINKLSFGGGAVNDSVMHLSNSHLPFGGVEFSGIGAYHGKAGFDSFTHYKSILKKSFWFEPPIKYPPYSKWKLKILKWLFE